MQQFMSRFGGHGVIIGQGKASDSKLPEDQSLDYLLDHYATEVVPNTFYISSYDARPEWMGMYPLDLGKKLVKIGTLQHEFYEIFTQDSFDVTTDIYARWLNYANVYAVYIRTRKDESIECTIADYVESYDLVLAVFFRDHSIKDKLDNKLSRRPDLVKQLLVILCQKMGLWYKNDIREFTPSKTHAGKTIDAEFSESLKHLLVGVESDDSLAELLLNIRKQNPRG